MSTLLQNLKLLNYWEQKPNFDIGYIRSGYLNNIEQSLDNKLIKVIVGQRRTGKSYIIRQIINLLIEKKNINTINIFYLNKELFEFDEIKTAKDLSILISEYENEYQPKGKIYIFIDEIQNISEWEKIIVSLAQNPVKEYEVIITGSNSFMLSGELASLLSGRFLLTEIFPFTYNEFLDYFSLQNTKANFIEYITTSGLPEIYNLDSKETKRNYFQSLKNTILLKDIMLRNKIRDYVLLEDLFLFIINNVGNLTSVTSIVKYFKSKNRKVDYSTIANYISYMQDAFILHHAPRYSLKNKEILSGEKKYFINDIGFRNYLYPNLINDFGSILENIVFLHLRKSGYDIKIGFENNFEIDFFASKNNTVIYIQVAYLLESENTIKREFGTFGKIKDNFPKYVLSMDDLIIHSSEGIIHEKIWEYLYNLS